MIGKYRLAGIIVALAGIAFVWAHSTNVAFTEDAKRENNPKKSRKGHWRPDPEKMFERMDANGDGSVTKDEFMAAHRKRMGEMRERMAKGGRGHHKKAHGHARHGKKSGSTAGCRLCRAHSAARRGHSFHGGGRTVVIHNHYYGGGSRAQLGGHHWGPHRGHHGDRRPHDKHHRGHRGHRGKDGDRKHTGYDDHHADVEQGESSTDEDHALQAELAEIEALVYDQELDSDFQGEDDSAFPPDSIDVQSDVEESEDDFSVDL